MKSFSSFMTEVRKKKIQTIYDHAWERLKMIKGEAEELGEKMVGSLQLFVPRPVTFTGVKDLHPTGKVEEVTEAVPFFPGTRMISPPGNNKPRGAFWTSTAIKTGDDSYTSDWVKWVQVEMPQWGSPKGYLYKVNSGNLILELNSDYDATVLFRLFQELMDRDLGNASEAFPEGNENDEFNFNYHMQRYFPWHSISRHFDAVTHTHPRSSYSFTYGWDVESTAWFDMTRSLKFLGEVSVASE